MVAADEQFAANVVAEAEFGENIVAEAESTREPRYEVCCYVTVVFVVHFALLVTWIRFYMSD